MPRMEHHRAKMLVGLLGFSLAVSLRTCSSFTMTSRIGIKSLPSSRRPVLYRMKQTENDENFDGIRSKSNDEQRRKLLKSFLASSAAITSIITDNNSQALAVDTETDQQKVVMQVSSSNVPEKYVKNVDNRNERRTDDDWMTEVEARRINVFEKAAPSVVYIDTYVESRDAFSTNV